MKNKIFVSFVLCLFALSPMAVRAQDVAAKPIPPVVAPDLSTLPAADLVLYVSPAKILNEAMPRLLPAKQNEDLKTALDQTKKSMAVDLAQMNFIVLALRMHKPVGSEPVPLPEFLLVLKGGVGLGTLAFIQQIFGKDITTEKYGTHDVLTYTSKDIAKMSEQVPLVGSYSEFALTVLHDDTYAVGTTSYVHAAIDADEGRGRITAEMARSITRDPDNLIALNVSMVTGVARAIALISPERADKWDCLNTFGQMYAGVQMTANGGVRISGAMNGDNPETAGILKNMVAFLLKMAQTYAPDDETKAILAGMTISVEGNEVVGSGEVSPATIQKLMEKKTAPVQQPQTATPAKTAVATPPPPTHRRRRRTH